MTDALFTLLKYIVLADLFALTILVLFLVNARINLKRQVITVRFYYDALAASQRAQSSFEAASMLNMDAEAFRDYCREKLITLPEERREKQEKIDRDRQEREKRIMEEEAAWRAEQEHSANEYKKEQEAETRRRMERLRKFGFR